MACQGEIKYMSPKSWKVQRTGEKLVDRMYRRVNDNMLLPVITVQEYVGAFLCGRQL